LRDDHRACRALLPFARGMTTSIQDHERSPGARSDSRNSRTISGHIDYAAYGTFAAHHRPSSTTKRPRVTEKPRRRTVGQIKRRRVKRLREK
jgi:hypothetical protein